VCIMPQGTKELLPYYPYALLKHAPDWLQARERVKKATDAVASSRPAVELHSLYESMLLGRLCAEGQHESAVGMRCICILRC
jgi:hypothetical protein